MRPSPPRGASAIEKDVREIPIPDWDTRQMSSKASGPWRIFFRDTDNTPIIPTQPVIRSEYLTNPKTRAPVSTFAVSFARPPPRPAHPPAPEFIDSYMLLRWRREREQDHQQIFVRPQSSLSRPPTAVAWGCPPAAAAERAPRSRSANRCPVAWHPRFARRVSRYFPDA
jgi:hypothetical protein